MITALALLLAAAPTPERPLLVTVDDLPFVNGQLISDRAKVTEEMLAVLAKHKIKAIGFVTATRILAPSDRKLLERWIAMGHELGNHSNAHLNYSETDPDKYIADVEKGRKVVAELAGKVRFFRFPFLREGNTPEKLQRMRSYLASSGQRNVPVTIDNQDWSFEKPWLENKDRASLAREYQTALQLAVRRHEEIGDQFLKRRAPQILLLHATAVGAAQWDELFTWLTANGHRFATADEVLADPAFAIEHLYAGEKGFGLWDRLRVEKRRTDTRAQIAALLEEQAKAWSSGDLDGFCKSYSDDARFLSPSGTTIGREPILERYRKKYGNAKQTMGVLTLEIDELRLFEGYEVSYFGDAVPSKIHGASAALKWRLKWADKPEASGLSLIVLEPRGGTWVIVQDASM